MAIVRSLNHMTLERETRHTEVNGTYSVIVDAGNRKYLQIDTYGSADRQILDKKSQSIRFSPEAIQELREILRREFGDPPDL